jgi:hypothetical protein
MKQQLILLSIWLIAFTMFVRACPPEKHTVIIKKITKEVIKTPVNIFQEINVKRQNNIATDFNNPGCIRNGNAEIDAIAIGWCNTINGKFLVFDTPQDGFLALQMWLNLRGEWSLNKAINVFAPTIENNTNKYINDLCGSLNCNSNTKLKDINQMQLMTAISKIEGFEIDKT